MYFLKSSFQRMNSVLKDFLGFFFKLFKKIKISTYTCLYFISNLKFSHCHRFAIFQLHFGRRWEAILWLCWWWRCNTTVVSTTTFSITKAGAIKNSIIIMKCFWNPKNPCKMSFWTAVTGLFIYLERTIRTMVHRCTCTNRTL